MFTLNSIHFPPLPFFGDCQLGREVFNWWVSLSPLAPSLFSRNAGCYCFCSFPWQGNVQCLSLLSLPYTFGINISFKSQREKKLSKTFAYTWNDLHQDLPTPHPGPLNLGDCSWTSFLFFRVFPSFMSHSFSFHMLWQRWGAGGSCSCHEAREQFQTLMESSSD